MKTQTWKTLAMLLLSLALMLCMCACAEEEAPAPTLPKDITEQLDDPFGLDKDIKGKDILDLYTLTVADEELIPPVASDSSAPDVLPEISEQYPGKFNFPQFYGAGAAPESRTVAVRILEEGKFEVRFLVVTSEMPEDLVDKYELDGDVKIAVYYAYRSSYKENDGTYKATIDSGDIYMRLDVTGKGAKDFQKMAKDFILENMNLDEDNLSDEEKEMLDLYVDLIKGKAVKAPEANITELKITATVDTEKKMVTLSKAVQNFEYYSGDLLSGSDLTMTTTYSAGGFIASQEIKNADKEVLYTAEYYESGALKHEDCQANHGYDFDHQVSDYDEAGICTSLLRENDGNKYQEVTRQANGNVLDVKLDSWSESMVETEYDPSGLKLRYTVLNENMKSSEERYTYDDKDVLYGYSHFSYDDGEAVSGYMCEDPYDNSGGYRIRADYSRNNAFSMFYNDYMDTTFYWSVNKYTYNMYGEQEESVIQYYDIENNLAFTGTYLHEDSYEYPSMSEYVWVNAAGNVCDYDNTVSVFTSIGYMAYETELLYITSSYTPDVIICYDANGNTKYEVLRTSSPDRADAERIKRYDSNFALRYDLNIEYDGSAREYELYPTGLVHKYSVYYNYKEGLLREYKEGDQHNRITFAATYDEDGRYIWRYEYTVISDTSTKFINRCDCYNGSGSLQEYFEVTWITDPQTGYMNRISKNYCYDASGELKYYTTIEYDDEAGIYIQREYDGDGNLLNSYEGYL